MNAALASILFFSRPDVKQIQTLFLDIAFMSSINARYHAMHFLTKRHESSEDVSNIYLSVTYSSAILLVIRT